MSAAQAELIFSVHLRSSSVFMKNTVSIRTKLLGVGKTNAKQPKPQRLTITNTWNFFGIYIGSDNILAWNRF